LAVPKDKSEKQKEHEIDTRTGVLTMPPVAEKITVERIVPPETIQSMAPRHLNTQSSVSSFSVASLQQYTDSFTEENLISKDNLTKVYLAELPDGKVCLVGLTSDFCFGLILFLIIILLFPLAVCS